MNNKILVSAIIIIGLVSSAFSQTLFRRAAYLSQSVGTHIYDHSHVGSPGTTTIPNEVAIYNSTHGYTGNKAFSPITANSMAIPLSKKPSNINCDINWPFLAPTTLRMPTSLALPKERAMVILI